ncbi:alpha/beta hydrolase [Nocardioides anomalus]|uniref:Alpha/beta hydrolase n=1 Tax=Nocardioides anomalus TaxID=2712223 RepID=A0A6G6WD46_9ACTN|nr:alpha/beta hydrolase [Nocardioides anomalus]QIG43073.1 alpha/beta hydrolase [Nocardioides anomalus]
MTRAAAGDRCDVEVGGLRLSCLRAGGPGPTAVLLHGLLGSAATWAPVTRLLEAELRVVAPDARGHGRSSAPTTGYRYEDLAGDVVGLLDALHLDRPVLVGHSMGGLTALLAATRLGPRLRGLVLVDPTFLDETRQREVYADDVLGQHLTAVARGEAALLDEARSRHPHRSPEVRAAQVRARLDTAPAAFDVLRPPNPPYDELVAALDVPTLLVVGDAPVVTPDVAERLVALNPLVHVQEVADAGHGLPFDQPEQLVEAVLTFVRGLSRPARPGRP